MPAGSYFWARPSAAANNETARMNRGNGIGNCIAAFAGEHGKCQTEFEPIRSYFGDA
jgi:hypothetical protein